MKKLSIMLFALLSLGFGSCGYLDGVVPDDTATLEDAFKNQENAQKFIYSIYGHIGNMNRYWIPGQIFGGDDAGECAVSCGAFHIEVVGADPTVLNAGPAVLQLVVCVAIRNFYSGDLCVVCAGAHSHIQLAQVDDAVTQDVGIAVRNDLA